jgi:hypothetical protein
MFKWQYWHNRKAAAQQKEGCQSYQELPHDRE